MSNTIKKIIAKNSEAERLDIFLSIHLKISRSQAQKLIAQKTILVNDELPKKAGDLIKLGDQITVGQKIDKIASISPKKTAVKKVSFKIKIIKKTPDYLVVEKPYGLLTHSTEKNEADSLANILAKKYPELKKVGEDKRRPGIVHRLDKEASGLLVVARNQKMFNHLKEQFKNRTVEKEYLALAHGQVAKDWDEIKFPIERSRQGERMSALPATHKGEANLSGKEAYTEFDVIKRFINFTLLKVKIHTGRMHQIRAHLLAYNHPLVSDPLYFQKKRKDKWDKICGRLFLHCTRLAFTDLDGQKQEFESALPADLEKFLLLLK